MYHTDGQLYKPDLAIHTDPANIVICDVQVSCKGTRPLADSWSRKLLVYENQKFREAASRRWPGKNFNISPSILGARGIWPRANAPTEQALDIPNHLNESCVQSCLKWGGTLHRIFMASVWRKRPPDQPRDAELPITISRTTAPQSSAK